MSFLSSAFFTRIIAILMGIIAMFTGGNMENVSMEVKNQVTTDSESIVFEMYNYTGKTLNIGKTFTLEENQEGEWEEVTKISSVDAISATVYNLTTYTQTIDIKEMFGKNLEAGEYKLTKDIGENSYSVTFTVTEA